MVITAPRRILAPDFARGAALLGIAIANAITAWSTNSDPIAPEDLETYAGIIVDDSLWDKIAVVFGTMFVHVRGLPMFTTLLGYGIGMILVRERTKNTPDYKIRAILARRYIALIFVGIIHTIFLFYGDIMFNYGLIAIAIILCYNLRDKTLLWISGILWSIGLLLLSSIWLLDDTTIPASYPYENGYVTDQISIGIVMLSHVLLQYGINLVSIGPVMLLGFIAGRRSVLEHPDDYARYMRIAATISVLIILGVGIPWGLAALGILDNENFWFSINQVIGMSSGPGLVVFLSWAARWLENRNLHQTLPIRMITTLGRMSMTGYVLQSILFTIIMVPWALGIGSGAGAATVTLIAFGIWIITLVFAFLWDRTGKRGPLETIHRTLAYGSSGQRGQVNINTEKKAELN